MVSRDTQTAAPTHPTDPALRALVVDSDGTLTWQVASAITDSTDRERFAWERSASASEALERMRGGDVDVVLLPIGGTSPGLVPLVKLRAEAPGVPVIALCAAADEPLAVKAVQLGAADYLVWERLYGTIVVRSLRHAVEAERVRAALTRQRAEWPPSLGAGGGSVPAALRNAFPAAFDGLVEEYGEILDAAVESVLLRRPPPAEHKLQRLAAEVAQLRAGPRDVVDLHATAMKKREAEHGAQRMKLYAMEGRLRLLELMGYLLNYYRDRWVADTRPTP